MRLALKVVIQNDGDFLDVILPYITFFMESEANVAVTVRIALCWDGTSCVMIKIRTFRRNLLPPSPRQINCC